VTESSATPEPQVSRSEERANSVSHGVGLLAAVVAGPFLVARAVEHAKPWGPISAGVFVVTIVATYFASTFYHALPQGPAKRAFRKLEHCAIFLLIAGTYTPFTVVALRGRLGWTLLGLVWMLALLGMLLKCTATTRHRWLPGVLYLGLGWIGIVAIRPLSLQLSPDAFWWLLGGAAAYTVGMAFFAAHRVPYCHCVWHLFVLAGTACHFVAVWQDVV
jgi:hemolysin III